MVMFLHLTPDDGGALNDNGPLNDDDDDDDGDVL